MPTYYDPILCDDLEFNQETIVYIIKIQDSFCIKAISSGLESLTKDPTSNATHYWLLDAQKICAEQLDNQQIFIEGKLTVGLLTLQQVTEFFNIDTLAQPSTSFDPNGVIRGQHLLQYAQDMADENSDDELFRRAVMHQHGQDGEVNLVEAIILYEQAIDLGNAGAMVNRALMHQLGQGGPVNFDEAIRLYDDAIDLGNGSAMVNRANMHQDGQGGMVNFDAAIELYEQAILLNDVNALLNRALMHQDGQGCEVNFDAAIGLYEQAIEHGDADAMVNRGLMYEYGQGGEVNLEKALMLFERSREINSDCLSVEHVDAIKAKIASVRNDTHSVLFFSRNEASSPCEDDALEKSPKRLKLDPGMMG